MKIDAESAEYEILLGMEWILSEVRPAVSIEVGDYSLDGVASSSNVVKHMIGKGYRPHEWRDGALRPHELKATYGYGNLWFIPE